MFARCSCWRCLVKERDYCVEIWNDAGQHYIRIDEIDRSTRRRIPPENS